MTDFHESPNWSESAQHCTAIYSPHTTFGSDLTTPGFSHSGRSVFMSVLLVGSLDESSEGLVLHVKCSLLIQICCYLDHATVENESRLF